MTGLCSSWDDGLPALSAKNCSSPPWAVNQFLGTEIRKLPIHEIHATIGACLLVQSRLSFSFCGA